MVFWASEDVLLNPCKMFTWEINPVEFGEINEEEELLAGDFFTLSRLHPSDFSWSKEARKELAWMLSAYLIF